MEKHKDDNFCEKLKFYVDGEADTLFEYFMLLVVIVNTVTLGLETSPSIEAKYSDLLFWYIFVLELLIKAVAFNREFFGEMRTDSEGERFFHVNKWNVFDLFIVLLSTIGSLPFFAVFRVFRIFKSIKFIKGLKSLRVMKTLKLINGITSLRVMVKAIIKAFPSVLSVAFHH